MSDPNPPAKTPVVLESISAVTLAVHDMARAVGFYRALGFTLSYGGETARFTSFALDQGHLNLAYREQAHGGFWGRVIFYVSDVDGLYQQALAHGLEPDFAPRNAEWGERYFHIKDPDGHELSFARPLLPRP